MPQCVLLFVLLWNYHPKSIADTSLFLAYVHVFGWLYHSTYYILIIVSAIIVLRGEFTLFSWPLCSPNHLPPLLCICWAGLGCSLLDGNSSSLQSVSECEMSTLPLSNLRKAISLLLESTDFARTIAQFLRPTEHLLRGQVQSSGYCKNFKATRLLGVLAGRAGTVTVVQALFPWWDSDTGIGESMPGIL